MVRAICLLVLILSCVLGVETSEAVHIPMDDVQDFETPCALGLEEVGPVRTLTWSSVSGASSYRIGYRTCDGTIVGLAEVPVTTYAHVGWDAAECLEYLMVAYDSAGKKVCAAHILNVGTGCPCP